MYQLFYTERDNTLYERFPDLNAGIDPILELTKIASGSNLNGNIQANTYNTRILLDFGAQITTLTNLISTGKIPALGNRANRTSVYLSMQAADASDLNLSYTLKAFPVSQSWANGNGNKGDTPQTKVGSSWYNRSGDGKAQTGIAWNIGSAASGNSGQGVTETAGGGTWMTGSGYEASQSFSNELPHIRMNVTDIVSKWVEGAIDNNGFIIKRPEVDERSGDILGNIQYYGRETHTIFIPRMEVAWDDQVLTGTSSYAEISSETYVPFFKNIKRSYREADNTIFRIGVRPEFPNKTYQTSSFFITKDRLPTSSFYSIQDTVTQETIIPFDTKATKISCDTKGSFFKLQLDTFMPERYYKILLKVERDGGDDVQVHDDGYYFKVEK
tara:strand:- start:23648 stop:24802 length:1155 start_codon:yes stop_codon:yes gene_type:complete